MDNIKLSASQKEQFNNEIQTAKDSVQAGNIPRSRVCARRALGILLKVWLLQQNCEIQTTSSYDLTKLALNDPAISEEIKEILQHFILRVDAGYHFPPEIDLLSDIEEISLLLRIET